MNEDKIKFVKHVGDLMLEKKKLERKVRKIELRQISFDEYFPSTQRLEEIRKELEQLQIFDVYYWIDFPTQKK